MKALTVLQWVFFGLGLGLSSGANADSNSVAFETSARACWLGMVDLFDAHYRYDPISQQQCLQLDYLTDFSRNTLVQSTWKGYAKANSEEQLQQDRAKLEPLVASYRDVDEGDAFKLCVSPDSLELKFNGESVYRSADPSLNQSYLAIWLRAPNPVEVDWSFRDCS